MCFDNSFFIQIKPQRMLNFLASPKLFYVIIYRHKTNNVPEILSNKIQNSMKTNNKVFHLSRESLNYPWSDVLANMMSQK